METFRVQHSAVISAPAGQVYGVFADYEVGHPAILPKSFFEELIVEEGGYGEGTLARVIVKAFGRKVDFLARVTEPQPGLLVETNIENGQQTSFKVEPVDDLRSRVTLTTDYIISSGVAGWVEKLILPSLLKRIYRQEIENVDTYIREGAISATPL